MNQNPLRNTLVFGIFMLLSLAVFAELLGHAAMQVKSLDRTVTVKGLSERDVPADIAIWPIRFQDAGNNLPALFDSIQAQDKLVADFLTAHGLKTEEITVNPPAVTDLQAQNYGDRNNAPFRYTGLSTITVYSQNIAAVRAAMADVIALGRKGIAMSGQDYDTKPEFLFTKLNDLKPAMIAESTQNARAAAEKFAADSQSRLGKIKTAAQGQISIEDRDKTTPQIKRIRVISTVEYYLAD